ncbi:MAG: response regulator [Anaerolineae bacterium]|nr:response regulator [Anaerolineae bacterium]
MKKHWDHITSRIHKSLRLKIIMTIIAPTILIQIAVGLFVFFAYNTVTANLAIKRDRELARLAADQLAAVLNEEAEHNARQGFVWNILEQSSVHLPNSTESSEDKDSKITLILDETGIVVATMPDEIPELIGEDWSNYSYVVQVMQSLNPVFSNWGNDGLQGGEALVMAAPVLDQQEELKGIVIEFLTPSYVSDGEFYEKISQVLWKNESDIIYIVDGNGRVVYHSYTDEIGKDFYQNPIVQQVLSGQADAIRTQSIAGHAIIASFAPIPGTSWGLVIEGNWAFITREMRAYQGILVLLLLLGLIAPAMTIAKSIKRVISPIEDLTAATQKVARGNFDHTITVRTGDEIETLATQFNEMALQLQESYAFLEERVRERTAQLAAVNERYRAVSELTSDYIYHLTLTPEGDSIIDWATDAFSHITGYPPTELANNGGWIGLIHPNDLPYYQEQREAVLTVAVPADTHSLPPVIFEYRIIAKGKKIRWLRDYWRPMWDADAKRVTHILGASQDITRDKIAEQALLRAKEAAETAQVAAEEARVAAESANRAKSVFLANMSHELRTPLNAILGYSQLMARDPQVTQIQQEYLDTIGRSGEHLLGLINDVLTMSKIEAGRTTLQEHAFDLHRQLEGLSEMFSMQARDKELTLLLDIMANVPRYIYADEGKLRQILMNLLSNAVKFTEEGGVTLRVRCEGSGVRRESLENTSVLNSQLTTPDSQLTTPNSFFLHFEVEDTGVGIAPEEMKMLFDPFIQTASGQKSLEGTGLGLPISQQFVTLMGGEMSVSSVMGQGSVFRVQIPATLAEVEEVEIPSLRPRQRVIGLEPDQHAPDGGSYRLLVVEDQPANYELLIKLLTPFGFDVHYAVNGKEGIDLWEQWQPHLVWMDMRMPVMDGYEATRQIKMKAQALGRDAIVIALTASAFEEDRNAIMEAGCDDFVRKPFRENEIFDALARHLQIRFIYETLPEGSSTESRRAGAREEAATPDALRPELQTLPAHWAVDMYQATTELDADRMELLIDDIRSQTPRLADILTQWIHDFEYEKIMRLTEN